MSNRTQLGKLRDDLCTVKRQRRRAAIPLKPLGELVSDLVRCPSPDLQQVLSELWACIRPTKTPIKAAFVPKRFSSSTQIARLRWLQLLVMVAQAYGPRRWVVPRTLDAQASRVGQAIAEAQDAWQKYSRQHGSAVIDDLVEAIECLLDIIPEGLSLDGRHVVVDGVKIARPLTPKERLFLALLIKADGRTVLKNDFRNARVPRAYQIKSRLVAKSEFTCLEDYIVADPGCGYRLI